MFAASVSQSARESGKALPLMTAIVFIEHSSTVQSNCCCVNLFILSCSPKRKFKKFMPSLRQAGMLQKSDEARLLQLSPERRPPIDRNGR
jgi:hypothetical protein